MSFLLYWYLPALVMVLFLVAVTEKKWILEDLLLSLVFGLLGWVAIIYCICVLANDHGAKTVISFEHKKKDVDKTTNS